jgi:hypothetical protein
MEIIKDEIIVKLLNLRKDISLLYGSKQITDEQYDIQCKEISQKIADRKQIIMAHTNIEPKQEEQIMVKEQPVEQKVVKEKATKVVKEKKDTRASLILKALQMKSIKNVNDVAKYVKEKLPSDNEVRIKAQTCTMIKEIVAKKKKSLANATWDEATYTLTVPAQ